MSREQRQKNVEKQAELERTTFRLGQTVYQRCLCFPPPRVILDRWPGMCPKCHLFIDPRSSR